MSKNIYISIAATIALVVLVVGFNFMKNTDTNDNKGPAEQVFIRDGLKTNTAVSSVDLSKIIGGGPGKDGIPAINEPKFTSASEAEAWLKDDDDGILVRNGGEAKFYPYRILVWHEITNDTVGGKPLVVTFCPLCGSAIVFDANVDGKAEIFGVSGKLYESNLLMYDRTTESLWSQIIGEAIVGDKAGEKLEIFPSQVLTFGNVKAKYSDLKVLSRDTGWSRNYNIYPYGDYDENDDIFFPISVRDNRLPSKEIMYIVNVGEQSVAFKIADISELPAKVETDSGPVTAAIADGEIVARDSAGNLIPGYFAMWFSWAIHHQEDGIVWTR